MYVKKTTTTMKSIGQSSILLGRNADRSYCSCKRREVKENQLFMKNDQELRKIVQMVRQKDRFCPYQDQSVLLQMIKKISHP